MLFQNPSFQFNRVSYNQWSKFYDSYSNPTIAIDEMTFPSYWKHMTQRKVLEIGCGTGRHTTKLAAQGNSVTGIDLAEGMLDVARKRTAQYDVTLIQADILSYSGFEQNSFHSIVSALVIEHISNLDLLFLNLSRLLEEGGKIFLSEIHPDRASVGSLAHFKDPNTGEEIRLASFPHRPQSIQQSSNSAGLTLLTQDSIVGNELLSQMNPKWKRYLKIPMIQIWVFEKGRK